MQTERLLLIYHLRETMPIYTLFQNFATPGNADAGANTYTLGVRLDIQQAGQVVGLYLFWTAQMVGPFVGQLWDVAGNLLATKQFVHGSGWTLTNFDAAVNVGVGTYCITISSSADNNVPYVGAFFATTDYANGPLVAHHDIGAVNDGGGWYNIGVAQVFPTTENTADHGLYGVDISFSAGAAPPPGTPVTGKGQLQIASSKYLIVNVTGLSGIFRRNGKQVPLYSGLGLVWQGTSNGFFRGHLVQQTPEIIALDTNTSVLAYDITAGLTFYLDPVSVP